MSTILFDNGAHKCVAFTNLVEGEGVQASQFLICHNGDGMLIDPGGNLTYKGLLARMADYFLPSRTRYVFASHADPDIIASLNGWLLITDAQVLIAQEWERFLPHFCLKGTTVGRLKSIPSKGMDIYLNNQLIKIIPAHYLHTVGNFHIYDPISKILFSGDVGTSLVDNNEASMTVLDFDSHIKNNHVLAFHQRYMQGNKACRLWVQMVRTLDVEWIVPQHGASYKGKKMVNQFLDWFEQLECGIDTIPK